MPYTNPSRQKWYFCRLLKVAKLQIVGLFIATMLTAGSASAGNLSYQLSSNFFSSQQNGRESIVRKPCRCQPRQTLLQWSYGTSFSGGPNLSEPLVTDRPDFTEAASTVGRGVAQLEMGFTYVRDVSELTTTATSYPELLLRYGLLAEWLELRIGWTYLEEDSATISSKSRRKGSDDLYLGFKIGLTPQEGLLPEMALIPQMTVPIGSIGFSAEEVLPGLNWIYGWEWTERLATAGSTQVNRSLDAGTNDPYLEVAQSATIAFALTERLGMYTEWFVLVPDGADTNRTEHYFNGGFTLLLSNNLQLDLRAGTGLNQAADDFFGGMGAVVRF
ncbi:MAG: transporter [Pirellulaceae bacterium]|nr:transporter [Pirellulaceae bacterium]